MKTVWKFVCINHTTSKTPVQLRPWHGIHDMVSAWLEQIRGPFADAHGAVDIEIRVGESASDRQGDERAINFRDEIAEAPGALAYHQVVGGVPDIEVGCDLFETLTQGPESISGGVSHELLETLMDPGANLWGDKQDGTNKMAAREACDVVQNTGYEASNGVYVSNFLLETYFIPGAPGPWDMLGVMKFQGDLSNGYEIQAEAPTSVTQAHQATKTPPAKYISAVGLSQAARRRKGHPYSRTRRRGVYITNAKPVTPLDQAGNPIIHNYYDK